MYFFNFYMSLNILNLKNFSHDKLPFYCGRDFVEKNRCMILLQRANNKIFLYLILGGTL